MTFPKKSKASKGGMHPAVKALPPTRTSTNGFAPVTPSKHQKSTSGIPPHFRNLRAPNAKPGALPPTTLPGC